MEQSTKQSYPTVDQLNDALDRLDERDKYQADAFSPLGIRDTECDNMSIKTVEVGCQTRSPMIKAKWSMLIDREIAEGYGYRKTAKNLMLEPIDTQNGETPGGSRMLLD